MRIALIDPSLFTLPYDAALASGLEEYGHAVSLYGRRPGRDDSSTDGIALIPVFYRMVGSQAASALPRAARLALKGLDHVASMAGLRRRLQRDRPDVIHFQWLPLPLVDQHFLAGLRRVAPLVLTVHDTKPFNGSPAAGLQRFGATGVWSQFDRLIVHTEQGRARLLEQGADPARVMVAPHGLLGEAPESLPADPMQATLTFLLFGKIKPYKGADLLIEAFAQLDPALHQQARLRVIGKPYMDLEPLRTLASARGVADRLDLEPRFVADDETASLFGPGTIATFPYREIEASGVLSMAIAHGRPILASRLGGFAEIVANGRHGLLVPPENAAALASAMRRFLSDRAFAAACAEQVRALTGSVPSWRDIAGQTAELYGSLARGHP